MVINPKLIDEKYILEETVSSFDSNMVLSSFESVIELDLLVEVFSVVDPVECEVVVVDGITELSIGGSGIPV